MPISATVHVLPNVDTTRIFEVRRLAAASGCQFVSDRSKRPLNFVVVANGAEQIAALDRLSARRFIVLDDQPPFGGDAA
ncbi:hypothetical protein P3W55_13320 [Pseudomonas citronellolis]|uniref:Uncharacterized protein n=1 Tax=Pseudomonas citronellolis TaxID=53408 RepID=A0AAW6P7P1_9PSED|nr:hypothetical protein [Pseudomonas citronellolis]MDF3842690.1 hypothetical protein [Pseudomonas citronellolis]